METILRPNTTKGLVERLQEGRSINLIGKKGTGRTRLLQDIKMLAEKQDITAVIIDFKRYRYNYDALVAKKLPEVIRMHIDKKKPIFLLFNNFDYVFDDPKQRIPKHFFDNINAWKVYPKVAVLCVTQKSHKKHQIYYTDEKGEIKHQASWLDLLIMELPALQMQEIRKELHRCLQQVTAWTNEEQQEYLVEQLHGVTPQMTFIKQLVISFQMNPTWNAKQRWFKVREMYAKHIHKEKPSVCTWKGFIQGLKEISEIIKNVKK